MIDNPLPPQPQVNQQPHVTIHEHRFSPIVKKTTFVILFLVVGLLGLVGGYFYSQSKIPKHTLTVKGVGYVSIPANEATITIRPHEGKLCGLISGFKTLTYAQDYNTRVGRFEKHLNELGIPSSDIEIDYSLDADIEGGPECKAPSLVTVRLTNPSTVAKDKRVLDLIKSDLEYMIPSSGYSDRVREEKVIKIKDIIPYRAKARDLALKDAANQVAKIVELNHKKIGNIISVKDIRTETQEPTVSSDGTVVVPQDSYYYDAEDPTGTQVKATYEVTYEQY